MRIAALIWLVLASCATTTTKGHDPNAATGAGSGSDDLICTEETPTGSNIPRTVCRRPERVDDARDEAKRTFEKPRPTPCGSKGPAGC